MTDLAELAKELESVVRSVPGVTAVYPATPVVATVVAAVVSAVVSTVTSTVSAVSAVVGIGGDAGGDAPTERTPTPVLVAVTTGKAGLKVAASIGVASADSSTQVCRHVYEAIAASVGMADITVVDTIVVTVASID